jgi:hypothetical protein
MKRPILKTSICAFITLVLVYYSVAWAVLGCLHDEDFANTLAAASALSDVAFRKDLANPSPTYFDCMGADYQTEVLGGVSAPVELRLSRSELVYHSPVLATPRSVRGTIGNLWLSALFDDVAMQCSRIAFPLYLSISVLRI